MRFLSVEGTLKDASDREVANAIFDFFIWQRDQAISEEIETRCRYNSAIAANEASGKEYDAECVGGFGKPVPYSSYDLFNMKTQMETAAKNSSEAKLCLRFIKERFVDKFIEPNKYK